MKFRKAKRTLTIITAVAMAGSLAACGGSGGGSESSGASSASGTSAVSSSSAGESVKGTSSSSSSGTAANAESPYAGITAKDNYDFQIIVKAFSSTYWETLMQGAKDAGKDLGVTVHCQGPNSESDTADQVNMFNAAINNKPDGIGIAANDASACSESLKDAKQAGVPIVAFDSGFPDANDGEVLATIATDSYEAGKLAGQKMWEAVGENVKASDSVKRVGIVGQDTVSISCQQRGTGFIDGLCESAAKDNIKYAVTGNDYYINSCKDAGSEDGAQLIIETRVPPQVTPDYMQAEATALMNKNDLVGIFAYGGTSTEAIIAANENLNRLSLSADNGVIGIGFDAGTVVKTAISDGTLYGAVTQTPYMMGYNTVCALTAAANGDSDKVVDYNCPVYFYNAENMNDPEIAPNLYD